MRKRHARKADLPQLSDDELVALFAATGTTTHRIPILEELARRGVAWAAEFVAVEREQLAANRRATQHTADLPEVASGHMDAAEALEEAAEIGPLPAPPPVASPPPERLVKLVNPAARLGSLPADLPGGKAGSLPGSKDGCWQPDDLS